MYQIFQLLTSIIFFLCYYFYDIYVASLAIGSMSFIQLAIGQLSGNQITSFEKFSLGMLSLFGMSTWYFRNPLFIQWKVTILHALVALFIVLYLVLQKQSLFAGVLRAQNINLPNKVGQKADQLLAAFMFSIAVVNYYIFTFCSEYTWVLFKSSLIFINLGFLFLMAMYIGQYIKLEHVDET